MSKQRKRAAKLAKKPEITPESGLTAMQERFCLEIAGGCTGKMAATRAGYSEKTAEAQASRLLRNVKVQSRVRALQAELLKQMAITKDWVLLQLQDCVVKSKTAEPVMVWDEATHSMKPSGLWMYDSKGATKALELMGKELGMFRDDKTVILQKPTVISGGEALED